METDQLADPRITAMGLLTETYTGIVGHLARQLAEHDLALIDFEVLLRLARSPGAQLRMADLAAQTSLSTSGATRVIDRLENAGLVERTACPVDRRGFFATITPAGRQRLDQALPGHVDLIDRWFTGVLSAQQLDHLVAGLRAVRDVVRPGATAPQPSGVTPVG